MNSIGNTLLKEAQAQQAAVISNEVFYAYLDKHPELFALVAAARRSNNLTIAMVNVHAPGVIQRTKKRDVDALIELQENVTEFGQWLVTAGKKFNFPIFRGAKAASESTIPQQVAPRKRSKRRATFHTNAEKLPINSKMFSRFVKKVGGTIQAAHDEMQRLCKLLLSQKEVAEVIQELYGVKVKRWTISEWMRALNVKTVVGDRKRKTFSNARPKQNLGKADKSLRANVGLSLLDFTASKRARRKRFSQIADSVYKLTQVRITPYSLTRIAAKHGIV